MQILTFINILISLVFFITIPYYVERPTKKIPYVTFGLIGLNILIFLGSVVVNNVALPADHIQGLAIINQVVTDEDKSMCGAGKDEAQAKANKDAVDAFSRDPANQPAPDCIIEKAVNHIAGGKIDRNTYDRIYQIQHVDDELVLEPHYSVLDEFAYRASEPSFGGKLLGMACSMFLHADTLHILGNMLYLWVFGAALEDVLGPVIYTGAYIVCGFAATLAYHLMTTLFVPQAADAPLLGASGAIAGVMGLFVVRFYRTPVRIFYITVIPLVILVVVVFIGRFVASIPLQGTSGWLTYGAGFFCALGIVAIYARKLIFGVMKIPSFWAIGIYMILLNVLPGILSLFSDTRFDSTAHWAHIGGFLLGMLYALLIGSQDHGKSEFMLEDAQKALTVNDAANAIAIAENFLEREPSNGAAYETIAKAMDLKKNEDAALDNYELAIQKYMSTGLRAEAARLYIESLTAHPRFIMDPATQLALGTQLAKDNKMKDAAETLIKIPYTFPDAPEGEISLLRGAQLYLSHLNDPAMAQDLLLLFRERYPQSEWLVQANRAMTATKFQLSSQQAADAAESAADPEGVEQ